MSLSVLLAVAFVGAALYYVCPLRFRWVLLLLLSYGFYLTCGVSALPFILITTLTTWAGALKIGRIGESGKAYLHEHKAELTAEEKKARKAEQREILAERRVPRRESGFSRCCCSTSACWPCSNI